MKKIENSYANLTKKEKYAKIQNSCYLLEVKKRFKFIIKD